MLELSRLCLRKLDKPVPAGFKRRDDDGGLHMLVISQQKHAVCGATSYQGTSVKHQYPRNDVVVLYDVPRVVLAQLWS
jgi:hypothetical protein